MKKGLFTTFSLLALRASTQNIDPTKYFQVDTVPPRTQDFVSARNFFIESSRQTPFEIKKAVEISQKRRPW